MRKTSKVSIRGVYWKIHLVSEEYLAKLAPGAAAVTLTKTSEIFFSPDDISLQTVLHELIHAYFAAGYTNSAGLRPLQVEEALAELFAEMGILMIKQARHIRKRLVQLSEEIE